MKFRYDGQDYKTQTDANTIYEQCYFIQLPDRRYLEVSEWLESMPPKPKTMEEVPDREVDSYALVAQAEKC